MRSLASNGTDVYIGTDSVNVAGIPQADHVARWSGSAWSALGANSAGTDGWLPMTAFIYAMAAKDSQVVVTGSFQNANGDARADHIASFDGTAWKPLGSNGAGNGPWIGNGLAVAIVGKDIYAGGNFTSAGADQLASYIARFAPQAAPSNLFTIGAVKGNRGNGTATITVNAPGAGTLTLSGAGVRRVKVATPSSPAKVKLTVQATGKARQTLIRAHHVKVTVTITFLPTGGSARSRSTSLVLKKQLAAYSVALGPHRCSGLRDAQATRWESRARTPTRSKIDGCKTRSALLKRFSTRLRPSPSSRTAR